MDLFQATVIGIIEGFTEFLPISSTGHMIVASDFLGLKQGSLLKAYEVIIQLAAILAVIGVYPEKFSPKKIGLWIKLFVAFLPIAVVGYLFKVQVKALFDVKVVAWMFIAGGIVFLIVEYFYKEKAHNVHDVESVTMKQAFAIGIAQVFALIPGTSRAGSTIIGALLVGLDRKTAAEFSFLLAVPVMAAVSGYDLLKHYHEFAQADLLPFVVGFIVAFATAYATIKLLLAFLQRFTFVPFGIYRILFGAALLFLSTKGYV